MYKTYRSKKNIMTLPPSVRFTAAELFPAIAKCQPRWKFKFSLTRAAVPAILTVTRLYNPTTTTKKFRSSLIRCRFGRVSVDDSFSCSIFVILKKKNCASPSKKKCLSRTILLRGFPPMQRSHWVKKKKNKFQRIFERPVSTSIFFTLRRTRTCGNSVRPHFPWPENGCWKRPLNMSEVSDGFHSFWHFVFNGPV